MLPAIQLMMSSTKRKAVSEKPSKPAKRVKVEVPDYHLTPSNKNEDGTIQWPAPQSQIDRAREVILEW